MAERTQRIALNIKKQSLNQFVMRKILFLFVATMLFSIVTTFAQNCDYSGTAGQLQWCLKSGTLTISGSGAMPEYDWVPSGPIAPWYQHRESINTVVIENGVTKIGSYAFWKCTNLIFITIPKSVAKIGDYNSPFFSNECTVFSECIMLNAIEVDSENSTYSSDKGVLFNKNKTTLIFCPAGKTGKYIIPNSVTNVEKNAFMNCQNLFSIHISDYVTNIGINAFKNCTSLTSITIPHNVSSMEIQAFGRCTSLASVIVSDGVASIGPSAFSNCTSLTSIILPNSLTSIEKSAFAQCTSLTSIAIPSNVTSIGNYAFRDCPNLISITNLNPVPVSINYTVFQGLNLNTCTLKVPVSAVSTYQSPYVPIWKDFYIIGCDYYVQVCSSNNEYGYAISNELYPTNATATVTATAFDGCKFVYWTKDGIEVSKDNPYSFTVTEDVELVAHFENIVGIENIENVAVIIYPNPTAGKLKVESGELRVENFIIYDVLGKIQKIENWKKENTIDISHLPAGIYFVKISTETGEVMRKVVKE